MALAAVALGALAPAFRKLSHAGQVAAGFRSLLFFAAVIGLVAWILIRRARLERAAGPPIQRFERASSRIVSWLIAGILLTWYALKRFDRRTRGPSRRRLLSRFSVHTVLYDQLSRRAPLVAHRSGRYRSPAAGPDSGRPATVALGRYQPLHVDRSAPATAEFVSQAAHRLEFDSRSGERSAAGRNPGRARARLTPQPAPSLAYLRSSRSSASFTGWRSPRDSAVHSRTTSPPVEATLNPWNADERDERR